MLGGLFGSKPETPPAKSAQAAGQAARSDSTIGAGATLAGTLIAQGNVRIAGTFEGNVTAAGEVLILEGGMLKGDLLCDSAVIAGQVQGNITARRVAVKATGQVLGDLRLERLASDEGGFVKGLVTMEESIGLEDLIRKAARGKLGPVPGKAGEPQAAAPEQAVEGEAGPPAADPPDAGADSTPAPKGRAARKS
ncbi:MAG: hypothetical protein Kow00124_09630 [Anaerolineae bacterium]